MKKLLKVLEAKKERAEKARRLTLGRGGYYPTLAEKDVYIAAMNEIIELVELRIKLEAK